MKSLATLVLTVAVAGCGVLRTDPEPPPSPAPQPSPINVTLTAQAPSASTPLPRIAALQGMRITVVSLNNPAIQGVLINVMLAAPDGRLANVGTFSPYPVDRPGSSTHLRLSAEAVDIAAGPVNLVLQMTAMPDGAQISPDLMITLTVTLVSR